MDEAACLRPGGRRRGRDHQGPGRRPRRPTPTTRSATPTCTRRSRRRRPSSPRCTGASTPARDAGSTCRWPRRCCTSTSTSTTSSTTATTPGWIRSFGPGDYLVVTTANGDLVTISGHPAERGTFEVFVAAFGLDDLAAAERFATVEARLANFTELATASSGRRHLPRRRRVGGAPRRSPPGRRQGARGPRAGRVAVGERTPGDRRRPDRRGGTIRIPNPPWRFDDVPGEITGEPRYRGEDNRAVLSELLGYDDARSTSSRRPASCPAASRGRERVARRRFPDSTGCPAELPPRPVRSVRRSVSDRDGATTRWSNGRRQQGGTLDAGDARAGDAGAGTLLARSARCSPACCCRGCCWRPGTAGRRPPAGARGR